MNEKIYSYKRPIDYYYYKIASVVIWILFSFILIREWIQLYYGYNFKDFILTVIYSLIIGLIFYLFIQFWRLFNQYDRLEKNKVIRINENLSSLIIQQGNEKELQIDRENFKYVEVYESRSIAFPLKYFEYFKIILIDNTEIIITNLTIPKGISELSGFLKGIKRKRFSKFFNFIN